MLADAEGEDNFGFSEERLEAPIEKESYSSTKCYNA